MTGVIEEDRSEFAVRGIDSQHRNTPVNQAARVHAENDAPGSKLAPVHGQVRHTGAPRKSGGLETGQSLHRHVNQFVLQAVGKGDDVPGVLRRHAGLGAFFEAQDGRGMGVR